VTVNYHLDKAVTDLSTPDIGHSWTAVHDEWAAGAMNGFYTTDGINAMGYYTAEQLPFYYSLFDEFTLCTNYFGSLMGPTWPNRFYLAAGTSGGITTNGVWGYGVFDYSLRKPIQVHRLARYLARAMVFPDGSDGQERPATPRKHGFFA
jgi:phospholipase C